MPLRRALLKQIQNGFAQLGYHATAPLLLKNFAGHGVHNLPFKVSTVQSKI